MSSEKRLGSAGIEQRVRDRDQVIEDLFGKNAREGFEKVTDDETIHVPGYYENYADYLTEEEIDGLLAPLQELAIDASNLGNMAPLIKGRLDLARVQERQRRAKEVEKEAHKDKKQAKKEAKKLEKKVDKLEHKIYP